MGQPRIQRMRQAPGARGVGFFGVLLAAGGIPPQQVVGSSIVTEFQIVDGTPPAMITL